MNSSEEIAELADAVTLLAGAVEKVASGLGHFDATNDAQVCREKARALQQLVEKGLAPVARRP